MIQAGWNLEVEEEQLLEIFSDQWVFAGGRWVEGPEGFRRFKSGKGLIGTNGVELL